MKWLQMTPVPLTHPLRINGSLFQCFNTGVTNISSYLISGKNSSIVQICKKCINVQTRFQPNNINQAACNLAKGVAQEGGAYFACSICQTGFLCSQGAGKDVVMKKFREEIEFFIQNNVDMLIGEVSV